ncbi:MAG: hypothetical protein WAW59_02340 [Patescibacteria group bacterium]
MTEKTLTSSIKNEDAFHDIIATERAKRASKKNVSAFDALAESIHATL